MSENNETTLPAPVLRADPPFYDGRDQFYTASQLQAYGDAREAQGRSAASEHVRRQVGKIDKFRGCMSYNDSYFGEPAGLLKSVVAELARAVDPIYPEPTPEPDPLAGVTVYTETGTHTAPFDAWWEKAAPDLIAMTPAIDLTPELEWRWIDEKGRAMTNWKVGDPPPVLDLADEKGTMRVQCRLAGSGYEP